MTWPAVEIDHNAPPYLPPHSTGVPEWLSPDGQTLVDASNVLPVSASGELTTKQRLELCLFAGTLALSTAPALAMSAIHAAEAVTKKDQAATGLAVAYAGVALSGLTSAAGLFWYALR